MNPNRAMPSFLSLAHPHFLRAPRIFGLCRGAIHCAPALSGRDKSRPYDRPTEKIGVGKIPILIDEKA